MKNVNCGKRPSPIGFVNETYWSYYSIGHCIHTHTHAHVYTHTPHVCEHAYTYACFVDVFLFKADRLESYVFTDMK